MLKAFENNLLDLVVKTGQKQTCRPQARELSQMIPVIKKSMLMDIDISLTMQADDGRQFMVIYNRDDKLTINRDEEDLSRGTAHLRLRRLIAELLAKIKFSLKASGTSYLIEGIYLLLSKETELHRLGITKEIYPKIGERYGVSPVSVERSIRMAIENAWSKMSYDYAREHYPYPYTSRLGRPTNQELIFALVRMIRLDHAEYLPEEPAGLPNA